MIVADPTPAAGSIRRQLRLLRYARPYLGGLSVLLLTMLIDIALELLRPWPLKLVIDNVLGSEPIPDIVSLLPAADSPRGVAAWASIGTVLIFLFGTASSAFYNYLSLRLGQRMTFSLAADLFAHLQRQSLLFHNRRPLGDM